MSRRVLAAVVALALLGSACGSDEGGGPEDRGGDTTAPADGAISCPSIDDAAARLGLAVQILAQLRTAEQYALVKDGTLALDPAATLEDIATLRALEGIEVPAGYGSVEDALDTYEEAATLAQANLAVDDPFADAQGDELAALTERTADFLSGQVVLGLALDGTDC